MSSALIALLWIAYYCDLHITNCLLQTTLLRIVYCEFYITKCILRSARFKFVHRFTELRWKPIQNGRPYWMDYVLFWRRLIQYLLNLLGNNWFCWKWNKHTQKAGLKWQFAIWNSQYHKYKYFSEYTIHSMQFNEK